MTEKAFYVIVILALLPRAMQTILYFVELATN